MQTRGYVLPDWNMVSGESKVRTVTLRNEETGERYNLEGATATFTVVDFVNYSSYGIPLSVKDVTIDQDDDGYYCQCKLRLNPSDTSHAFGKFIYQLTITDARGNCSKMRGILYIAHSADF